MFHVKCHMEFDHMKDLMQYPTNYHKIKTQQHTTARGVGGRLKMPKKTRPGPDGRDASRWYGRLYVQKLTLLVLNCAHAPEQFFLGNTFLIRSLPPPDNRG